ncbi:MAG: pyridoxamine 5'-phosphate oxidase family protein [Actinomycetota bacterium]|nr:pyridoxamine 5'-phosphate oxidase family protein [Actinomycetota bacterium]
MRTVDVSTGIEFLDREQCLRLLATDDVGRLAIIAGGAPVMFPVNYALDGDAIVFRTDPGTKSDFGPRAPACFEVDCLDRAQRAGWSVVVSGRLEEVTRYDEVTLGRLRKLPLAPWAGGPRAHWLRLVPERITGRRVVPTAVAL